MRLAVCTLSAVLLSGCSWLGSAGHVFNGGGQGHHAKSSQYGYGQGYNGRSQHGQHQYSAQQDPCQVYSPQAPIPQGCNPSQVTLGTAGGFPQQPNFGGGQYASQGYGSHAATAHQQAAHYQPRKTKLRKPRLRGLLSLGVEKSNSGNLLDYAKLPSLNPELNYDPNDYNEGVFREGSIQEGRIDDTLYTAIIEEISKPDISFDDVHSTPLSLKGGVEYIMTPRTSVFANAGYTYSEGRSGGGVGIQGELQRRVRTATFQTIDGTPATPGSPEVPATPTSPAIPAVPAMPATPDTFQTVSDNGPVETAPFTFIPNQNIANYAYDFTDMQRIELEVGARHYFNPIVKSQGYKTLTPFVGASVGAAHYNAVSLDVRQNQLYYQQAFEDGENIFYDVVPPNINGSARVELYDSQWVPAGQLNAGMEWQVTPKTALAFETGLRIEGAREYSNGERGDNNIAIPMTIRGSYNF